MSNYQLNWLTENLATGYAPMSYADLDSIRQQGIDAIVNLCGEYCDLHELEEKSGFEVYYLPIPDESAPDLEDLEMALAWMDEAIHLGKKILVHCRHGIGRTGTFVTSYLLRRGLGLKRAQKELKHTRANPTSYPQWKLLKKYNKKSGVLKSRQPTLHPQPKLDLSEYFGEYENILQELEQDGKDCNRCEGLAAPQRHSGSGCQYCDFRLTLIEAAYLTDRMNKVLKNEVRKEIIHKAMALDKSLAQDSRNEAAKSPQKETAFPCPLCDKNGCTIYEYRPISCRIRDFNPTPENRDKLRSKLHALSRKVFYAITGKHVQDEDLTFSLANTVSGRFIQTYFNYLARLEK